MTSAEFWDRTMPVTESGCWIWMGTIGWGGYGVSKLGNKHGPAHRHAWIHTHGPIPNGMFVCHHCDVPLCVNPDHLFLGTHADNMRDKAMKLRAPYGEKGPSAKLTDDAVRAIRASSEEYRVLAARYGVRHTTIWKAKNRETWRHLADESAVRS